jgi:hypothetical protein
MDATLSGGRIIIISPIKREGETAERRRRL